MSRRVGDNVDVIQTTRPGAQYAGLGAGTSWAVAGWFRVPDNAAGSDFAVIHEQLASADFITSIQIRKDGRIFADYRPGGFGQPLARISSAAGFDDDQWHYLLWVSRATNDYQLWIDGSSIGTNATAVTNSATLLDSRVAKAGGQALPVGSMVARWASWRRALTVEQGERFLRYGIAPSRPHWWWELGVGEPEPDLSGHGFQGSVLGGMPRGTEAPISRVLGPPQISLPTGLLARRPLLLAIGLGDVVPVTATFSSPWEATAYLAAQGTPPTESLLGLSEPRAGPWESRLGLSTAGAMPSESLAGLAASGGSPWEALLGLVSSPTLPLESRAGVATVGVGVVEQLTGLVAAGPTAPWEALVLADLAPGVPLESLTSLAVPAAVPWESRGLTAVSLSAVLPWEALAHLAQQGTPATESLLGLSAAQAVPWESRLGVAAAGTPPIEWLAGLAATGSNPWEALAGLSAAPVSPTESQLGLAMSPLLVTESRGLILTVVVGPWEAGQGLAVTGTAPTEAVGGVVTIGIAPLEARAFVAGAPNLPHEWLSRVVVVPVAPWEALAGDLAATLTAPTEALAGVTFAPELPWEAWAAILLTIRRTLVELGVSRTVADLVASRTVAALSASRTTLEEVT